MNRFIATTLTLLFVASGVVADTLPVPLNFQYCTVCHGAQLGGSSGTQAPRLSHLPPWYVEKQLHAFKQRWRGTHPQDKYGNEMRIGAEGIASTLIATAAQYVASTQSALPEPTITGDVARGKTLFASCGTCHGQQGQGNQALNAPPIAGSSDWYLARQLKLFKLGVRGTAPQDTAGALMRASSAVLATEQDINDVVAYIDSITQQ